MNAVLGEQRSPILFLTHRIPFPPDKGDRIRTYNILKFLGKHSEVHLASLADEPVEEVQVQELKRHCQRVEIVPLHNQRWLRAGWSLLTGRTATEGAFASQQLKSVLKKWIAEVPFRSVLASSSGMAQYLQLPKLREIPTVVDLVDVDSQKWFDYAAAGRFPKSQLHALEGRRLRRLETSLVNRVRSLVLISEDEADVFRSFCPHATITSAPNGVDLESFAPAAQSQELSCAFVGALDYKPNVDGARWFSRTVWPRIHDRCPSAKLYLVGRRPVEAVVKLSEIPGVVVVGQVPDVRPWVARAAVSVNPLRIARGMQNKVLEALAMQRATIASPEALTGLRAEIGTEILSAANEQEWCDTVLTLFADPALRDRLGKAGRRYVERCHRWDVCLSPLLQLLGLEAPPATFQDSELRSCEKIGLS